MKKRIVTISAALFFVLSFFSNPCYAIKIGIQTDVDRIGIGASVETSLIDAYTNKTVTKFEAMKGYEIIPYKNTMAIASLKELAAIVLVKGLHPEADTVSESEQEGIPILSTAEEAFDITGKIYQLLHPCP